MALQILTDCNSIKTDDFANHTLITIPAGRMRGDVDGDGKITSNSSYQTDTSTDAGLIYAHYKGTQEFIDETQILCADLNSNGRIDATDISLSRQIAEGNVKAGQFCNDILGNWTNNPNYATEDGQFYTDIPITGITSSHSASVIVKGIYESGFFTKAECVEGAIRIYAKLCPIEALSAVVSWGTGDGTAVITTESEDLTAYAEHIANADIHVTTEEKAVWSEKEVFIITLTETTTEDGTPSYSADKTFDEIKAASDEGKMCLLYSGGIILPLSTCSSSFASFECLIGTIVYIYQANSSNSWAKFTYSLPPSVTTDDNGKMLQVVNGAWAAVTITNAEGVAY